MLFINTWAEAAGRSDLGTIEVKVRPRWRRAALVLVPGPVDGRAIRVLGRGASAEQAELTNLHARPELDRQGRDVGPLQGHVPGEPGIDPARRRVREQAQSAQARLALKASGHVIRK